MSYICLHCTMFTHQGSTEASRNLFCSGITQVCLRRDAKHLYNCLPDLSDTETVSDDYGIDDLAPMPELQTDNNIEVPGSEIELSPSQHDTLALAVSPLSDDQNSGVNAYLQGVGVIANFVHQ